MMFPSNPAKNHTRQETWWLTRAERAEERRWKKNGGWFSEIQRSFVHWSRIEFATFSLFLRDVKNISGVSISLSTPVEKSTSLILQTENRAWTIHESFWNRIFMYIYIYKLLLCSSGRFVALPMMRLLNIRETVSSGDESLY